MKFTSRVILLILAISAVSITGGFLSSLKGDKVPQQEFLSSSEETAIVKILESQLVNGLDSIVNMYHNNYNFNGEVLVNYKGYKIYEGKVGYANPNKKTPIDSGKAYQLASVSKQFTAAAIMMLEEENEINYDDKVVQFFPQFPYEDITVKHLLNHTSGLPNYMWLIEHKYHSDKQPYNDEVIDLLAEQDLFLNFHPGTRFNYSNTGYVVLASIVEKVSGNRFGQFLEQRIFDPLNMDQTFVYSAALDKDYPERINGFRRYGRYYRKIEDNAHDGVVGDKGVYSTASDLYKWDQSLYKKTLLPKNQLKQAFTRARLKNGNQVDYGQGFRLEKQNGEKVVYHNGLWNGFRTSLKRQVKDTISLIVLNNTDSRVKDDLVKNLETYLHNNTSRSKMHKLVMRVLNNSSGSAVSNLKKFQNKKKQWLKPRQIKAVIQYLQSQEKEKFARKLTNFYSGLNYQIADHNQQELNRERPSS